MNSSREETPKLAMEMEITDMYMLVDALEQYQIDNGRFPENLNQLVPDYWDEELAGEFRRFTYHCKAEDHFVLERREKDEFAQEDSIGMSDVVSAAADSNPDLGEIF